LDNVTNASTSAGKKGDFVTSGLLSVGTFNMAGEYTGVSLTANFKSDLYSTYTGLNLFSSGLSLKISQKFGLGPEAIRVSVYGAGSYDQYDDADRKSNFYKAGINASRWISETIKIGAGYEYDRRVQAVNEGQACFGYSCWETNVYDLQGSSGIVNAEIILTESDTATFSYRRRNGEVVSSDILPTGVHPSSTYYNDATFKGQVAYRLSASTDVFSAGISHDIFRKTSLNLVYSFHQTLTDAGIAYQGNVLNLVIAYAM
jgi:hypothetical protein